MATRDYQTPLMEGQKTLEICELFYSIAGESSFSGAPALFVRLSGCNLRCEWCDTKKSWEKGKNISLEKLMDILTSRKTRLVVITGGEPLLQPDVVDLCNMLIEEGKTVQVETNGSFDISVLPDGVQVVMDIKPPSSGEMEKMDLENLSRLRPGDDLKIVIGSREDFRWAEKFIEEHGLSGVNQVFLSPASGRIQDKELAEWMLDSCLDARLQLQLHRILWNGESDGRIIEPWDYNS